MDLQSLADAVRDHVRLNKFSDRERLVLDVLLDVSLAIGRAEARIARLDDIGELTGISRGNVHGILAKLKLKRVIESTPDGFRIMPPNAPDCWRVEPRVVPAKFASKRSEMAAWSAMDPNQLELIEPDKKLADALHEVRLEQAQRVPDSGTKTAFLNWERTRPEPVPDSGTKPENIDVLSVPDSGTSESLNVLSVHCLNASTIRHSNNEHLMTERVPDSGTVASDREAYLMELIAGVVGPDGMACWGGDWRSNWVRKFPDEVESALGEFRYKIRTGWVPKDAGAALKDLCKRFTEHKRKAKST